MNYAIRQCMTCTQPPTKEGFCPLDGTPTFPCGFDGAETERRKALPLKWDRETRTRRKYIGIKREKE